MFEADNVNTANFEFESRFSNLLESVAPMTKIQVRKKRSEWISTETKSLMRQRDRARDKAGASTLQADWAVYKSLRNLCKTHLEL